MKRKGHIEFMIPVLVVFTSASIALMYNYFFKAKDDNPVEEIAEEVIKKETGVDIDLSPNSPER